MPLRLIRSPSTRTLWDTCADRFLDQVAEHRGPEGHRAHLWITQRSLRDALLERAYDRGIEGWLAPPISFFSELPERFELTGRPIGLLTRRRLVARLAARHAERLGIGASKNRGIIRGHMMDGLLGELLPEGVEPDRVEAALSAVADDDFARSRNAWIASVYRDYLAELAQRDHFDPRSIHALLAAAIAEGRLVDAVGDAGELHIYGIYSLAQRGRLVTELARQTDVDVSLYTLREEEPGEWDELAEALGLEVEDLDEAGPGRGRARPASAEPEVESAPTTPTVQPAPDALREYRWVAAQVKRRLVRDGLEPHEIAVVVRQGEEDTRRACRALEAAGIPCTARVRMQLHHTGALKALLELFRGAATDWSYRPLRNVLASPYFDTPLDLRGVDFVATRGRPQGLEAWAEALETLAHLKEEELDRDVRALSVTPDRLRNDAGRLRKLADLLAPLGDARTERAWVRLTLELVTDGVLGLRTHASQPTGDHWDAVRFDQRGLRQLERLMREWAELDLGDDPLTPAEWHRLLKRLLEANELALSTPGQKGVQVLEAHDAAMLPFRAVYLTHANDGEFPRVTGPGGVLLEEERAVLRAEGLPLTDCTLALRRERSLWRAVVQGDDVTITYRTTDPNGTPLLPSLLVPEHDPSTELPRSHDPVIGEEEQSRDEVASPEAERRLAAFRLRETAASGEIVSTADPYTLRHAIVAAHAESARGVRDPHGRAVTTPNPWHGELRDAAVLERIARRFGPDHVWSPSQLEAYATCPFLFLIERVLRLRDTDEAEEETTPMTFGGVAHDILQEFYDAAIDALPPSFDAEARALFDRTADEVFEQRAEAGEWVGLPVLWRYEREEIRTCVAAYLEWELAYLHEKGERPVWCELDLSREDGPLELSGFDRAGRPQVLPFRGRVDRVDVSGEGDDARYHILDYKTSTIPAAKGYKHGTVLQAPLYMEALEQLQGVRAGWGRYRKIKKPGDPQNGCRVKADNADYQAALGFAFSIPARVRRGLFEPVIAASKDWAFYHPGIELTRTRAQVEAGHRFEDEPDPDRGHHAEPGGITDHA